MALWSAGSLRQALGQNLAAFGRGGSRPAGPTYSAYHAQPAFGAEDRSGSRTGRERLVQGTGLAALAAVAVSAVLLGIGYAGNRGKLRAARAQLSSVQAALTRSSRALESERQVGAYMRGARDALVPAQRIYGDSSSLNGDAAATRGADEQAIAAFTVAKQKSAALGVPASLTMADADIRSAIDALAGGLQAEVQAIDGQDLGALETAVAAQTRALDRLDAAMGEMYSAVGTSGPASGSS